MRNRSIFSTIIILLFSCTTSGTVPSWVYSPPSDTSSVAYFVGTGSDPTGDQVKAEDEAISRAAAAITRYLGVRITADSTVREKDAFGRVESALTSEIREQSDARISGMRIAASWVDRRDPAVVVHLLIEYDKAKLVEEQKRVKSIFTEKEEAVFLPEQQGDTFLSENNYYEAVVHYINAALAASSSGLENSELRFKRNIAKAVKAAEGIRLEIVSAPSSAYIGSTFDSPFVVKVFSGEASAENLPVMASYKTLHLNGRKTTTTVTKPTDNEGLVRFELPVPEWAGTEQAVFSLNINSVMGPLKNVRFELLQYVDGLEQTIKNRSVSYDFEVLSRAGEIPTCLMIMDVDRSGNPLDKSNTASGLFSVLSKAGFNIVVIPVDYRMTAMTDSELIEVVKNEYGTVYERLIFGTSEINGFEDFDGEILIKVSGRLKVAELKTGKIIFSTLEQRRAKGSGNPATISAAFNSLGKVFGDKLITELP